MSTSKPPMPPRGTPELYEKAVAMHKLAYYKEGEKKDHYKAKVGHMLQHLFGKSVWTLKDLIDKELNIVIDFCEKKLEKKIRSSPNLDTLMVSHGQVTHSLREAESCKVCKVVMEEFEQAKKDGTIDKIINEANANSKTSK